MILLNNFMISFLLGFLYTSSILYFGQIQYFLKVLKTTFRIQYCKYHMGTLYNI